MAFKTKLKNRLLVKERQTVDAKHNNVLQQFIENKSYLPTLKEDLEQIKTEITILNQENCKSLIINLELQKKIWKLDDRKRELEKEITNIEQGIDENTYMLKTGKILSDYYKILDQEKQFASGEAYLPDNINTINTIKNNMQIHNTQSLVGDTKESAYSNSNSNSNSVGVLDTNNKIVADETIKEKIKETILGKSVKTKSIIVTCVRTSRNSKKSEKI
jgi:hypothetical protein